MGDPALGVSHRRGVCLNVSMGDRSRLLIKLRDRHLPGLIEPKLAKHHDVYGVFGGSHKATLSAGLEARLGSPTVKPFMR